MKGERNRPCPCGSGKKYKVCCATKRTPTQWLALVSVVAFALLAIWVVAGVFRDAADDDWSAPAGKVWSAEHGHWHDEDSPGESQPPGPPPPGKVWSAEHGHWHDAPATETALPPGPAPAGKVWSAEHGHWHDGTELPALPPPPEEQVSEVPLPESEP